MAVGGSYGTTTTPGGAYRTYRPPSFGRGSYGVQEGKPGFPAYRVYRAPGVGTNGAPRPSVSGPATGPPVGGPAQGPVGFQPAPLPTGSYSPEHDILSTGSEEGLRRKEGRIGTEEARQKTDFWTKLGLLNEAGGNENSDYQRAKGLLAKSFQNLAGRQQEQQASAGVLEGGAALQAAQKRAANQGQQQEGADIAHGRAVKGNEQQIADLVQQLGLPDTANPLGGRAWQDLETTREENKGEDLAFRKGQYRLGSDEAAKATGGQLGPNGEYIAPKGKGAALHAASKKARGRRPSFVVARS